MNQVDLGLWCQYRFSRLSNVNVYRKLSATVSNIFDESLNKSQYWFPEERGKYHYQRISKLVRHAYRHVPFYRHWFDLHNINVDNIQKEDDLLHIPPISKSDLKKFSFNELIAEDISRNRFLSSSTSGSTGEPFNFLLDKKYLPIEKALVRRLLNWCEIDLLSKKVLVADSDFIKRRPLDLNVSITDLLNKPDRTLQIVQKFNDALLTGYASGLQELAELSNKKNITLRFNKIISFAEQLSNQSRNLIENTFKGTVYNFYGTSEVGMIARECKYRTGLHINEETLVVHIEKSSVANENKYGDIIVTSFTNDVMPFIRYKLGDVGALVETRCPCGTTLRTIEVLGRSSTIFKVGGKRIHQFEFNNVMKKFSNHIGSFQIVQDKKNIIAIQVTGDNITEALKEEIATVIREELDPPANFTVLRVPSLERFPGGKLKHVVQSNM